MSVARDHKFESDLRPGLSISPNRRSRHGASLGATTVHREKTFDEEAAGQRLTNYFRTEYKEI